jgi:hypothetical protein
MSLRSENGERIGKPRNDHHIRYRLIVDVTLHKRADARHDIPSLIGVLPGFVELVNQPGDDELVPVGGCGIQDDLPVDEFPFLVVGTILGEGPELGDRGPIVALQRFVHSLKTCLSGDKYRAASDEPQSGLYSAATRAIGLFGCVVQLA